jgi:hypothetical protein
MTVAFSILFALTLYVMHTTERAEQQEKEREKEKAADLEPAPAPA